MTLNKHEDEIGINDLVATKDNSAIRCALPI